MSAASAASSSSTDTVSGISEWLTIRSRSSSSLPVIVRVRAMPSFCEARASSGGRILSRGSRSIRGFVIWIVPRQLPPAEAWSSTGRWPLTRTIAHESRRVSPSYRPRPRESGWTSPNGSVRR